MSRSGTNTHWRFELHCPRCGVVTEIAQDDSEPEPEVICDECVRHDQLKIQMTVDSKREVVT